MAEFNERSEIEKNTQHPAHYGGKDDPYEVIKVLKAWGLDNNAYLWNTCKYISRAGKKNGNSLLQDLIKAKFYLDYYIDILRSYDDLKIKISQSESRIDNNLIKKHSDPLEDFLKSGNCVPTVHPMNSEVWNDLRGHANQNESPLKPATPPKGTAADRFTRADQSWTIPSGLNRKPETHLEMYANDNQKV